MARLCLAAAILPGAFAAPLAAGADGADRALIERGRYIALLSDCGGCHSAKDGKPYAGGTPLKSPFGTLYGANITPDRETGIGKWTKADFDKALRLGISKNGEYLYPAMPYEAYTRMTDADVDALWAYLQTVAPVHSVPPKNTLPFPLTIRSGLAIWQSLYFKPGRFEPDSGKSAEWNRGAYLVDALEHCSQCHTPRNAAQGLQTEHLLAGASISGWYAPDISNDEHSTIKTWSAAQLVRFLKTGASPRNGKAFGPMQETIHDSLHAVTDADLSAMAAFLKDQPTTAVQVAVAMVRWPDRSAAGQKLYEDACSGCHQSNGQGMPGSVPALARNSAVTAGDPYNVIMAILEGFPPQGTWGAMGSFAATLNDDEIADVTNYIRTAWGNSALPNATPWSVSTWRKNATPGVNQADALLCPNLTPAILKPALDRGPVMLRRAASEQASMVKLVHEYRAARPTASSSEIVEGLSTAYCRVIAADHPSTGRMSAQLADYAERIAVTLNHQRLAHSPQ